MGLFTRKHLAVLLFVLVAHAFLLVVLASVQSAPLKKQKKTEPLKIQFMAAPEPVVAAPKQVEQVVEPKPQPPKPKPKPKPPKPEPKPEPKPKPKPTPKPKPIPKSVVQQKPIAPVETKTAPTEQPFIHEVPGTDKQNDTVDKPQKTEPVKTIKQEQAPAKPLAGNVDARFSSKGMLEYPRRAQSRGLEGSVEVTFVIDLNGRAKNIKVTRTDDSSFSKAAMDYIKGSRFVVQKVSGQAVEQPAKTTVRFVLN